MPLNTDYIEEIVLESVDAAFRVHEDLGTLGATPKTQNEFGESALVCDVEAEKAVISVFEQKQFPATIFSEEHGVINLAATPEYIVVLDGLDGSRVYVKNPGSGRYGTMVAVFEGPDPRYSDYLISAVMEHPTKRLFSAKKHCGAFVTCAGRKDRITTSQTKLFNSNCRIYIDKVWDVNRKVFEQKLTSFDTDCALASCVHYVDVANGDADLTLESTRKRNLEIAVAYGLISEANGVMVTLSAKDIGDERYLEFGQDAPGEKASHIPIVAAATEQLAAELIEYLDRLDK